MHYNKSNLIMFKKIFINQIETIAACKCLILKNNMTPKIEKYNNNIILISETRKTLP